MKRMENGYRYDPPLKAFTDAIMAKINGTT
jgi:hypothetical protein